MTEDVERRTITLTEHGSVIESLRPDQALALAVVDPRVLDVRPTGAAGEYRLRAESHVGTLAVADCTVTVRPKVQVDTLLYLLSGSLEAVSWSAEQHARSSSDDLVSIIHAMYARLLLRSVRAGLVRSYRHRHDRVTRVQGRIDFAELASSPHRPFPAPCDFDEFTADTDLNRFLKAAAREGTRSPGLPSHVRRGLRGVLAAMAEVTDVVPRPDLLDAHVWTRLDRHFEPSARLARLILSRRSVAERIGATAGDTFLVDMSTVFEDHLAEGLRRRVPTGVQVLREDPTRFDVDGHLRMKPDIVFARGGRAIHVADVKYKLLKGSRARSADLYQALAYATVLGLPTASLLYAEREGGPPPKHVRVRGAGTTIETTEVSIRGRPEDIEASLDRLAAELHPYLVRSPRREPAHVLVSAGA